MKMKYIKKFEINQENKELFKELYMENPLHETHDFYFFIGSYNYKEDKEGLYKRILDIENMVRITEDNFNLVSIMELRTRFQTNSILYHIWLPKDIRKDVEGKSSNSIEDWLIELIDKYKMKGSDEHGKKVYQDVIQRRKDIDKFNI